MSRTTTKDQPEITKRRVTMRSSHLSPDGKTTLTTEAVDYVRPDHLDEYVANARTRWQFVEVSDEPDAGPAGYHGQTVAPDGTVYPATKES